jgi:hypothetical protein
MLEKQKKSEKGNGGVGGSPRQSFVLDFRRVCLNARLQEGWESEWLVVSQQVSEM